MTDGNAPDDLLTDVESEAPREQLAELFDLGTIDRKIRRVRVHGRGGKAFRSDRPQVRRMGIGSSSTRSAPTPLHGS